MTEKERYLEFCKKVYVPIYSQPWWLDAICGADNWDAKILDFEGNVFGAMALYFEKRGKYQYITKAPLTQNNGIIFNYPKTIKYSSIPSFEEKTINLACDYISSLKIDLYEQQYPHSFYNWSPFFWKKYTAIPRYTYIFSFEELSNINGIWERMDKKKRREIKIGESNCTIKVNALNDVQFYSEVEKVYSKQGINCPFTFELWKRVYDCVMKQGAGHIISAHDKDDVVLSTKFLVWDTKSMYALISGGDVKYQHLETKSALDWFAINDAAKKHIAYDFEGSMIERIAKAYRAFGATPRLYFRIRKVFNEDLIRMETEKLISDL